MVTTTNLINFIIVIGLLSLLIVSIYTLINKEGYSRIRKDAERIVAKKHIYQKNNDTFNKFKSSYYDADVAEYYAVRPILKSCDTDCVERVMEVID